MIGTIKIKLEGLNSGKIINALVDNGVILKNLKEKYKYVTFEICENNEELFKSICKKYRKRYEIISKNNFLNLLKRMKNYFGFLVSTCLVVAFIFSFNLYIFRVDLTVSSNNFFDVSSVEKLLKQKGIVAGMQKKELNISSLQQMIIASQENISGCTIKRNGGLLEVVIYPGILKENVSTENAYSKYNAVITMVDVYAGRTDLKVGDFVKQGDLLIKNDNGVKGKILGKVYFSDFLIFNENQMIKEFTGNEICKTNISLLKKPLFKIIKNIDFSNYIEENCVFSVSKNTFLPIDLVKTTYKEFVYKETKVDFLTVQDKLKDDVFNNVLKKVDDRFKDNITNTTYSVVREDNLIRLDCFIECEIDLISA